MQLPIRELLIHPFIYWVILILLCRCYYLVISCGNNFLKNLSQSPTLVCLNLQLSNLQYLTLMCLVMLIQVHQSMINKQRTLIPELFLLKILLFKILQRCIYVLFRPSFVPPGVKPRNGDGDQDAAITGLLQNLSLDGLEPQWIRPLPPRLPVLDGEASSALNAQLFCLQLMLLNFPLKSCSLCGSTLITTMIWCGIMECVLTPVVVLLWKI